MKGYLYLAISILTEVFGTAMLKLSEGFTVLLPTLGVAAGYGLSFYCLSLCLKTVPLSLAYAIWSGIGTALTALLGALVWGELFGPLKIAGVLLIIGGVIMLNSSSSKIAGEPEGQ
ncbi:multidrug efflux SMR transporter [Bhargavaea ginsengi]|uniref:DMT family transporter n=1 Tax=Bhargavaea ginsengi TaxID=426757 RepID=UPI00203E005E|nr:multidrug efflux SMR transporter [Bhargavaea ginsengi]MCM3089000.1 multidrug efflux SMR transporter [Bhargavaea ginsengi]